MLVFLSIKNVTKLNLGQGEIFEIKIKELAVVLHVLWTTQKVVIHAVVREFKIIGSFRLDYEYEIKYEYDFSILVFRLHIITTHTHFIR